MEKSSGYRCVDLPVDVSELVANFGKAVERLQDQGRLAVNTVVRTINDSRGLYYYPQEVEYAERNGLCDLVSSSNFIGRYRALIRGLPEESVAVVSRIIARLQRIKGLQGRKDIYSSEEKKSLLDVESFRNEVFKVSEEVFCYRRYFLPVNHFLPCVFLYRYGLALLKDLDGSRNKSIVDVGAYVGDSALILSEYTNKRVYAFEPSQINYQHMLKTIALNGLTRVVPENVALGSKICEARVTESADRSITATDSDGHPDAVPCRMMTLDSYVSRHRLKVGLIKVDIEGSEQDFIRGAIKTIKIQRPVLLVSIYHNAGDFLDIKPMIENLDAGYEFRVYHPAIKSVFGETLLICEQAEGSNRVGMKRGAQK